VISNKDLSLLSQNLGDLMMFSINKITKIVSLSFALFGTAFCATIPWDPSSMYIIPNDSNTYTLDTKKTLTADLTVSGILELLYGAKLINITKTISLNTASSRIYVDTGAALYNYYGPISMTNSSALVTLRKGGIIDNVRGSTIDYLTINTGGNFSDGTKINLTQDLDIDVTFTFTTDISINGAGYNINLGPSGALILDKKASALFEDISLNNVSENKIRCTENVSTLSLNNVSWYQDANFSFTKGKLYISGDWNIYGDGTIFSYETDQLSTVTVNASINVQRATFKYNTATNNLLYLRDASSGIYLDRATLLTSQACSLFNGILTTNGYSALRGDATLTLTAMNSFKFIDGINLVGTVLLTA
jgi:hypothetical protein